MTSQSTPPMDDAALSAARAVEQFYTSHFGDRLKAFDAARLQAPCPFCRERCEDAVIVIVRATGMFTALGCEVAGGMEELPQMLRDAGVDHPPIAAAPAATAAPSPPADPAPAVTAEAPLPLPEAALDYARRGWPVFPLHTPRGGGCSCGNPDCEHPGKHPRTKHGFLDATTDEAQIADWWRRWPDANIGIACGARSGLVVIDIDPRHAGDDALAALEREHGPLPHTVESLTGGGGRHLFFAHPGGTVRTCDIAPGVEIRADGAYIVAPPSLHASGRTYAWELSSHPDDVAPAPVPEWVVALMASVENPVAVTAAEPEKIRDGTRNKTLSSLAGAMRRRGMTEEAMLAALLEDNRRRCEPPLPEKVVRKIAASIGRYPPAAPETAANSGDEDEVATGAPWPAPIGPAGMHGLAGDFVRMIMPHTEADPAAVLVQILVAFGNVIGRGPHFTVGATRHYTNLDACIVGATSRSRKGTSWDETRRLLGTVDSEWAGQHIQGGLSSGEGLISVVRDAKEGPVPMYEGTGKARRFVGYENMTTDPGVQDKRLLVCETEFASALRVMERDGNILSPIIRQAWDTGDLRVMTKNNPVQATGAHISIIGHITKDELLRHLGEAESANGFGNRFLWVCARRSQELPEGGRIEDVDFAPFVRRLDEAVRFARGMGEMQRDEQARALWHEVYATLTAGLPGMLGAMVARSEAQVMRLACIYALLDLSEQVRREHLEAALETWRYCEDSARFIFGERLGDPVADQILHFLRGTDRVTTAEMYNHFGRHVKAHRLRPALALLVENGLVRSEKEPSAEAKGRPTTWWSAVRIAA